MQVNEIGQVEVPEAASGRPAGGRGGPSSGGGSHPEMLQQSRVWIRRGVIMEGLLECAGYATT